MWQKLVLHALCRINENLNIWERASFYVYVSCKWIITHLNVLNIDLMATRRIWSLYTNIHLWLLQNDQPLMLSITRSISYPFVVLVVRHNHIVCGFAFSDARKRVLLLAQWSMMKFILWNRHLEKNWLSYKYTVSNFLSPISLEFEVTTTRLKSQNLKLFLAFKVFTPFFYASELALRLFSTLFELLRLPCWWCDVPQVAP